MARIIGEVRPRFVWVENSPLLVSRGLGLVLLDLARLGYDARWGVVGADDAGAPHRRKRIWIRGELADAAGVGRDAWRAESAGQQREAWIDGMCNRWWDIDPADLADTESGENLIRESGSMGGAEGERGCCDTSAGAGGEDVADTEMLYAQGCQNGSREIESGGGCGWPVESGLGRVAHRVANRVDRLRAIGNGQVPAVVRLAWNILSGE